MSLVATAVATLGVVGTGVAAGALAGGVYSLTKGGNALEDIGVGALGGGLLGAGAGALGLGAGAGAGAGGGAVSGLGDAIGGSLGSSGGLGISGGLGGLGGLGGGSGLGSGLSVLSGLTGLYEASSIQSLAKQQLAADNPYGPYRGAAAQQLAALQANPSLITQVPGYNFQFQQGLDATQRAMGAQGYNGSGNLATAETQYGQGFASNFLMPYEQMLGQEAGVGISPNPSALNAYTAGAGIASQGLASLGYAAGGSSNANNLLLASLVSRGLNG
jgi:hypothetical protein